MISSSPAQGDPALAVCDAGKKEFSTPLHSPSKVHSFKRQAGPIVRKEGRTSNLSQPSQSLAVLSSLKPWLGFMGWVPLGLGFAILAESFMKVK